MTNKERVIEELFSMENLARRLIVYDGKEKMYITSDGNGFYWEIDAINHEIEWLNSEADT